MSPDPDQQDPEIPIDNRTYLSPTWCSLPWTPWVPFTADKEEFRTIPKEPGLYRIRPTGKDFLMFIGETRRQLHWRLHELRHTLHRGGLMPWSEPMTEAPSLWAWQNAEGYSYECSAAPLDASPGGRRGMMSYLLYQYRQEHGESTLCNFGRFHPRYRRSTNRKGNQRGGKLDENHLDNPAGGPSIKPLPVMGTPGERYWMGVGWIGRLPLDGESVSMVPPGAGLYLLFERDNHNLVYIGQSTDCAHRLRTHAMKLLDEKDMLFSYVIEKKPLLPHNLKEQENDLIGNYYDINRKAPKYQFGGSR
jgi:hypothetical protein